MRFELKSAEQIKREHKIEEGGEVQRYIDEKVAEFCEPYVPVDTGRLRDSAKGNAGSGKVIYNVDYAREQYYNNKGGEGLRGKMWFERMKADRGREIVQGSSEIAKGKAIF